MGDPVLGFAWAPILIQLAIGLALAALSFLLMPKPKGPGPQATQDADDPTAEAGKPIPVVFGTMTVKDPNVLWFGEKNKVTK